LGVYGQLFFVSQGNCIVSVVVERILAPAAAILVLLLVVLVLPVQDFVFDVGHGREEAEI
jgi:hypothetical protein